MLDLTLLISGVGSQASCEDLCAYSDVTMLAESFMLISVLDCPSRRGIVERCRDGVGLTQAV